jgi:hypothetical protein
MYLISFSQIRDGSFKFILGDGLCHWVYHIFRFTYGMIISILYTFCFIFPGALQIFHGYLSRKIEYPPNKTQVFSAWSIQIFGAHIEAI